MATENVVRARQFSVGEHRKGCDTRSPIAAQADMLWTNLVLVCADANGCCSTRRSEQRLGIAMRIGEAHTAAYKS